MRKQYLQISTTDTLTLSVVVESTDVFFQNFTTHRFWQEFIPDVHLRVVDQLSSPSFSIVELDKREIDESLNVIYGDGSVIISIIVFIEAQLEHLRQLSRLYTLHGSCIQVSPFSAVAFIGAISGLGKTTLSVAATERGYTWLFDEKFVIDKEGALRGGVTKPLNDQKTHLVSKGKQPQGTSNPLPLTAIIIPVVTTEKECTAYKLDQKRRVWQLYDETTRDIRQINGRLEGYQQPLRSYDSPHLATQRQSDMDHLARSLPIYHLRGSQSAILNFISQETLDRL